MPHKIAHDALAMIEYSSEPSVMVLADSDAGMARGRATAERAGCRVNALVPLGEALARLDRQVAFDGVLAEVDQDHGDTLDRLLERMNADASAGRHGIAISFPPALIDVVTARTPHIGVEYLCDADEMERVAAVALTAAPRSVRLHDVGKAQGPERLQRLSEEIGRIATALARLSDEEAAEAQPVGKAKAEGEIGAGPIRAMIRARRLRDHYFKAEFFADPAWDMLLDLMAARQERKRVAVSSLCIAAAVPPTTALRWIKTLTDHRLFDRSADPQDGRRVYIELSDQAAAGMSAYFQAIQRLAPVVV